MAVNYEPKPFKKAGRVLPGQEPETYVANQLTEDSIDVSSLEKFVADFLSVCGNDVNVMREVCIDGSNAYLRRLAGGSDEWTKIAKMIVKLGKNAGKSVQEIADLGRTGALKF